MSAQTLPDAAKVLVGAVEKSDPFQPPPAARAVFDQYLAAVNAGDLTRVRGLLAPDFTMPQRWSGCGQSQLPADCQLAMIDATLIQQHARLELQRTSGGRDLVRAKLSLTGDKVRAAKVSRVLLTQELAVSQGKIRSVLQVFHTEDADTRAYVQRR